MSSSNDGALKGIWVAGLVAFVCALVVSLAAVTLRPYQDANLEAERQTRVTAIIKGIPGIGQLAEAGAAKAIVLELGTDRIDARANPDAFDLDAQLKDETQSITLAAVDDVAGLKRRENRQLIYLLQNNDGKPVALILPVRGLGYASLLKGYLAIAGDGRTIHGLEFFEHAETPGLGARIDDVEWKAKWVGKQAFDDTGRLVIDVVKGQARTAFEVDAITGASRTSDGVEAIVRFWLGPLGYGPFLARLREG
ncbi:MAG TPA: NADH:ubiquinone reductase (Na(+)-transporting) subunit C [Magnetovibrio sp.]